MKKLFLCLYFTGVKEVFKNLEMKVENLEISKQIVEKYKDKLNIIAINNSQAIIIKDYKYEIRQIKKFDSKNFIIFLIFEMIRKIIL